MKSKQSKTEVYVDDDGFIRIVYHGDLDRAIAEEINSRVNNLIQQVIEAGRDLTFLLDLRDLGKHDPTARWIGREEFKDLDVKKAAIIMKDADAYTSKIVEISIERSPHKEKVAYFDDEPSAVEWLKDSSV